MSGNIDIVLPLKVGQNKHLDGRKNGITTLEQLRDWDMVTNPIPNGFTIYIDKVIYIYDESNEVSETTGKFTVFAVFVGEGDNNGIVRNLTISEWDALTAEQQAAIPLTSII